MRVLARFERAIQALVEGAFGRAFGGRVHPAEIGRRLVAEMRRTETLGLGKTYVANSYRVLLSPEDHAALASVADALCREYAALLKESAEADGYALYGPVAVSLGDEPALRRGQVRIEAAVAAGEPVARLVGLGGPARGASFDIRAKRVLIGRAPECDVRLDDPDVSRNHAALVAEGGGYVIEDLGSTNGTFVNGMRVSRARLSPLDLIEVGRCVLRFEQE